jgi:hypothetical protein
MLWALLGATCVAFTIVELVNLLQLRGENAAPQHGQAASSSGSAEAPPAGAVAPDVQFGDVGPAPEVTLDRRTSHDRYLAAEAARQRPMNPYGCQWPGDIVRRCPSSPRRGAPGC